MENESAHRWDTRPSSPCVGRSGAPNFRAPSTNHIMIRGCFFVPCIGRSNAQTFGAPILPTNNKIPGKIPFADPTLLKGSYLLRGLDRNGNTLITRWWLNYEQIEYPAPRSQTTTYLLIQLPTPLLSHRTLPLSPKCSQKVGDQLKTNKGIEII